MNIQFNNSYNPLHSNQQSGSDLTQGCYALDPKQIEQSLKFIPPGQLLPLLVAQSNQKGETLLDYIVEKVKNPQSLHERSSGLDCLHVLLQHFTPAEKKDFFIDFSHQAARLICLLSPGSLTDGEVDQLVSFLLKDLDVGVRKQIANHSIFQDNTFIHMSKDLQIYPLIRGLLEGFTEDERISILTIQDSSGRTFLHSGPDTLSAILANTTLQDVLLRLSLSEKIDLLSSPDTLDQLFFERCRRFPEETDTLVSLLLKDLDIETRKQIASSKTFQDGTIIHSAPYFFDNPSLIRGLLEGFTGDERMSILTIQDDRGRTPLHTATGFSPALLSALVEGLTAEQKKELGELQEEKGLPVLHYAALLNCSLDVVFTGLLDAGVGTIDVQDLDGNTLLHKAKRGNRTLMNYCLQRGANPHILNIKGEPALSPDRLEKWERTRDNWDQFDITYVEGEVEELHSKQWVKGRKMALLIFPKEDYNNASSIAHCYSMRENLVELQDCNVKLQRISHLEEWGIILDSIKDGAIDCLYIVGHNLAVEGQMGPGSVTLGPVRDGLTHELLATNIPFMKAIVRKMKKNGSIGFISCALALEEKDISIPQQLALLYGGTVIAGTKKMSSDQTYFDPNSPKIVRFIEDGIDLTKVFTTDSVRAELGQPADRCVVS